MKNLYVIKKVSKKEGREDFVYFQLVADLGYAQRVLTIDANVIAEFCELPVRVLYDLKADEKLKVAEYKLKGE